MRESRVSSVIQRFQTADSAHDQRRWHRDGWAVCPGGRFRPKLLKEMNHVACLAKGFAEGRECLQSGESVCRAGIDFAGSGAQMCIAPVRIGDAFDLKENVGISPFL